MNQLQVFDFEHQNVRTVTKDEKGYFNLNDVCEILDIKNPRDAKTRLRKDGVVTTDIIDSLGRNQNATFVDEGNLYKLIFQSRKDEAEKFQVWVTDEVLPQIRQTGKYETPKDPMEIMRLQFEALDQTNQKVKAVESDVKYLKEEVPLSTGEYNYISKHVNKAVYEAVDTFGLSNRREVTSELYKDINRGVNEIAGIKTRTQLKQRHFNSVYEFINQWGPSTAILIKVRQLTLDLSEEQEESQ